MNELICKKCNNVKSLDQFSEFIAITINGPEKRRRKTCYDCIYKKRNYKSFTWANSTEREQLARLEENFNRHVIKQDGCWDWNGFIRPDGYVRMKFKHRTYSIGAHVVSWMIHNKQIKTDGLFILHKCDNRKCTNPKHLYAGTASNNMIDMVNRSRSKSMKLTIRDVREIKKLLHLQVPVTIISKKYKVHWATISDIKNNKTWKHVNLT